MPKRLIRAKVMEDGDPSHISLVRAGANRQPIKVMKTEGSEETGVLNFKIKDIFKAEPLVPTVLAVAVSKGANLDTVREMIEAASLNTDNPVEVEGGTVYMQKEDLVLEGEGRALVRLSDEVSLIVEVEKTFSPFAGSTSFDENMRAQGFFPGVHGAIEALDTTLFTVATEARSKEEMVTGITAAANGFAEALGKLVSVLPENVFKLEQVMRKSTMSGVPELDGISGSQDENGDEIASSPVVGKEEVKTDPAPVVEAVAEEGEPEAAITEPITDENATNENQILVQLMEGLNGLKDQLAGVQAGVDEKIDALSKRVETAEATATKADKLVTGVVGGEAPEDPKTTTKADKWGASGPPLRDSAFDRYKNDENRIAV